MGPSTGGYAIFINGVQSASKSTVAKRVERRTSTLYVVSGDDLIRKVAIHKRVAQQAELLERLLVTVDEQLKTSGAIVDAALTERQVRDAQADFVTEPCSFYCA